MAKNEKIPSQVLKTVFGYSTFRAGQKPIISSILKKQDTLAIMPTGGGKSICFQIPGIIMSGTTVVVSPLISLMKDQVDTLEKRNISATYINSSLSSSQISSKLKNIKNGKYRFIYVAPERLLLPSFISVCKNISVPVLVVDEAHCISQWGHDFRPSYTQIPAFLKEINQHPTIAAFTATATPQTQQDIIKQLNLEHPHVFSNGFKRDNLCYWAGIFKSNFEKEIILFQLLKKHHNQAGIIFANTRNSVEHINRLLTYYGYESNYYHARLKKENRANIQESFLNNQFKIIVATNAFGMGVDKPNIRFVIHYHIPANLENYYQEAGRAGRDGKQADCYLLYQKKDLENVQSMILDKKYHNRALIHQKKIQLQTIKSYVHTNACRISFVLDYFGQSDTQKQCQLCDNCLNQSMTSLTNSQQKCLQQLLDKRKIIAEQSHVHVKQVITDKLIKLVLIHQPQSESEWLHLPGCGKGWVEKWGSQFIY